MTSSNKTRSSIPVNKYKFQVSNKNIKAVRNMLKINNKDVNKCRHFGIYYINPEHILHLVLVLILLTLNMYLFDGM